MRIRSKKFRATISLVLAVAIVLVNLPGAVFAQAQEKATKPRIAVWDFSLEGLEASDGRAITNRLRSELVNSEKYQVMSRDQIKTLLGEQELGQTLIDAKQAIETGKLKGVEFVVTGTVITVRGAIQITAEMIDGKTAEIIKSITPGTYRGDFLDFLDVEVPRIAGQLAGVQGWTPVASVKKPEEKAPPEPEPEPEPAVEGEQATWPLTAGLVFLIGAGVMQLIALASESSAEDDADSATTTAEYQSALDSRDSAEGLQTIAILSGLLGTVFLVYYGLQDGPSGTAANGFGPGAAPGGFQLEVQPGSYMAGYTLHW